MNFADGIAQLVDDCVHIGCINFVFEFLDDFILVVRRAHLELALNLNYLINTPLNLVWILIRTVTHLTARVRIRVHTPSNFFQFLFEFTYVFLEVIQKIFSCVHAASYDCKLLHGRTFGELEQGVIKLINKNLLVDQLVIHGDTFL